MASSFLREYRLWEPPVQTCSKAKMDQFVLSKSWTILLSDIDPKDSVLDFLFQKNDRSGITLDIYKEILSKDTRVERARAFLVQVYKSCPIELLIEALKFEDAHSHLADLLEENLSKAGISEDVSTPSPDDNEMALEKYQNVPAGFASQAENAHLEVLWEELADNMAQTVKKTIMESGKNVHFSRKRRCTDDAVDDKALIPMIPPKVRITPVNSGLHKHMLRILHGQWTFSNAEKENIIVKVSFDPRVSYNPDIRFLAAFFNVHFKMGSRDLRGMDAMKEYMPATTNSDRSFILYLTTKGRLAMGEGKLQEAKGTLEAAEAKVCLIEPCLESLYFLRVFSTLMQELLCSGDAGVSWKDYRRVLVRAGEVAARFQFSDSNKGLLSVVYWHLARALLHYQPDRDPPFGSSLDLGDASRGNFAMEVFNPDDAADSRFARRTDVPVGFPLSEMEDEGSAVLSQPELFESGQGFACASKQALPQMGQGISFASSEALPQMGQGISFVSKLAMSQSDHLSAPVSNLAVTQCDKGFATDLKLAVYQPDHGPTPVSNLSVSQSDRGSAPVSNLSVSQSDQERAPVSNLSVSQSDPGSAPVSNLSVSQSDSGSAPVSNLSVSQSYQGRAPVSNLSVSQSDQERAPVLNLSVSQSDQERAHAPVSSPSVSRSERGLASRLEQAVPQVDHTGARSSKRAVFPMPRDEEGLAAARHALQQVEEGLRSLGLDAQDKGCHCLVKAAMSVREGELGRAAAWLRKVRLAVYSSPLTLSRAERLERFVTSFEVTSAVDVFENTISSELENLGLGAKRGR